MKKQHYAYAFLGVLILIVFLIGRGCSGLRPQTNQKYVDSLTKAHTALRLQYNDQMNRLSSYLAEKDNELETLLKKQDSLRKVADRNAVRSSFWLSQYKAAKEKLDTPTLVNACDTLVEELETAYTTLNRERTVSDSLAAAQRRQLELTQEQLKITQVRVAQQDTTIARLISAATHANDQVKKTDKKRRWSKIWAGARTVVIAAAAFAAGVLISN